MFLKRIKITIKVKKLATFIILKNLEAVAPK
jgi:hypothetical protein